jgi:hypothetical protein
VATEDELNFFVVVLPFELLRHDMSIVADYSGSQPEPHTACVSIRYTKVRN